MADRKLTPYMIGGIVALCVAAVSQPAVGVAQSATAAAKKIQEVLVTNDAVNAVPVQIQGTSTVSVANMVPVQLQGTSDVNVVNAPGLVPVQKTAFVSFQSGLRFSDDVTLYTVPEGKQLILETFTIASNLSGPDQHLMHVLFQAQSGDFIPLTINVQPVAEGFFSSTGANIFRKTESVTAYAAPGTSITARGTRDGADIAHLDSLMVGFAGRLVDVP